VIENAVAWAQLALRRGDIGLARSCAQRIGRRCDGRDAQRGEGENSGRQCDGAGDHLHGIPSWRMVKGDGAALLRPRRLRQSEGLAQPEADRPAKRIGDRRVAIAGDADRRGLIAQIVRVDRQFQPFEDAFAVEFVIRGKVEGLVGVDPRLCRHAKVGVAANVIIGDLGAEVA
ncbi:hypothetical protein KXV85_004446, partial [Aspergillus fumigatus]